MNDDVVRRAAELQRRKGERVLEVGDRQRRAIAACIASYHRGSFTESPIEGALAMQKPSVGRVVHLCFSGSRVPGMITHVWSDTCVNIQTIGARAGGEEFTSCVYEAESEESAAKPNEMTTQHKTWCWPPRVG